MSAQTAMTEHELERFLEAVSTRGPSGKRNLALLTLMADSGLRVGEALGISTGDLVREHGGRVVTHVQVMGKGSKPARVPISARTAARLDTWLEARGEMGLGNGHVFCTISEGRREAKFSQGDGVELVPGKALDQRYVRDLVGRVAQRAGIEGHITPHTLRHTFATRLLRQTGNLELTRKALRHARVTTTARVYSHLMERDVEEAVLALGARAEAVGQAALPGVDGQAEDVLAALEGLSPAQRRAIAAALLAGADGDGGK